MRVDLPVTAYVPPEYIAYEATKIDAHRRIARARTVGELGDVRAELADRFGPPPEPVENLLTLQAIRLKAAELGADAVTYRGSRLQLDGLDLDDDWAARVRPPTHASSYFKKDRVLAVHREGSGATMLRWVEATLDAIIDSRVSRRPVLNPWERASMKKLIVAVVLLALSLPALLAACGGREGPRRRHRRGRRRRRSRRSSSTRSGRRLGPVQVAGRRPAVPGRARRSTSSSGPASSTTWCRTRSSRQQGRRDERHGHRQGSFQDRIKQIIQQVGGQKKLDKLLKQQGVTAAQLEAQLKAQMLQDTVQEKVVRRHQGQPTPRSRSTTTTPQQVPVRRAPRRVDARHVLVKTKAEAEKVRALLEADNSDANWKKVAKQYSTDPGSKNNGGSLGSFPKGRMVKPFEDAAFALKVDEISQPVKTQFGYHVIEVTKKTPGSKQTLEQAKATIEQQLKYQKQATAWETWLKDAMAAAGIAYAAGFDPQALTASPSPPRRRSPAPRPRRKDVRHAQRGAVMSLTLVYIGAAAGLAPAASLRALSAGSTMT